MAAALARLGHLGHHIDKRNMRELAERGLRAIRSAHKLRQKTEEQFGEAIAALEVNAASFTFGFARGYWAQPGQDMTVLGVPVDLGTGILLHVLALFGGVGAFKKDAHNFGNGSLASYTTTLGLKLGVEQAQKHGVAPAAAHGYVGMGSPMSSSELAGFVSNLR